MSFVKNCKKYGAGVVAFTVVTAPLTSMTYATGLADMAAGIDKADVVAGLTAAGLLIAGIAAARMGIRKVIGIIR